MTANAPAPVAGESLCSPETTANLPKATFRKGFLLRLCAIVVGLSPFIAAETTLRLLGIGRPTDFSDPFVGFSEVHPLFVLNSETGRYEIPPSRQSHFRPESFAAKKPANEFRIFVLGGSTVQGRPYAIETSFTTWLELSLNAADPSRHWEVVNCGGISYATYRLMPILEEVLRYQPDLIIFCEGHNEFLEERTYGHIKMASGPLSWAQRNVSRLHLYNILRFGLLRLKGSATEHADDRPLLGPEADAILDWKGGMAKYRRDPQWQSGVIAHFNFALRRVVQLSESADVPVLLIVPPSNLEWPPFKCEHRAGISQNERDRFVELIERARRHYRTNLAAALELLQQARDIDDEHAVVHFEIGKCNQGLGYMDAAKEALTRARDLDICPLRMLTSMKRNFEAVAIETRTPLIDGDALIAARCPGEIPGNLWLVDHVHPTLDGHKLIAESIAVHLVKQGYLTPASGWEGRRASAYEKHLAELARIDPAYFPRGELRRVAAQGWAHGRTQREKAGSPKSR